MESMDVGGLNAIVIMMITDGCTSSSSRRALSLTPPHPPPSRPGAHLVRHVWDAPSRSHLVWWTRRRRHADWLSGSPNRPVGSAPRFGLAADSATAQEGG